MEVVNLAWFMHNSKAGQYSSAKVHRSVKVDGKGHITVETTNIPGLHYEVLEGR